MCDNDKHDDGLVHVDDGESITTAVGAYYNVPSEMLTESLLRLSNDPTWLFEGEITGPDDDELAHVFMDVDANYAFLPVMF
jgi:hypothetical protein